MKKRIPGVIYWIFLIFLSSCTATQTDLFFDQVERPVEEVAFFKELDQLIEDREVKYGAYTSIEGFPYLRTDRFLADIRFNLETDQQKSDWYEALRSLDLKARIKEVNSLNLQDIETLFLTLNLTEQASRERLIELVNEKSLFLYNHESGENSYLAALQEKVDVPDDYSTAMRAFGLYPFAYLPVAFFSDRAFDKVREWHKLPMDQLETYGELVSYAPERSRSGVRSPNEIFQSAGKNALGILTLSEQDKVEIATWYAPMILQDTLGSYDQIGSFALNDNQVILKLDQAVSYYYFTNALINGEPAVQINYTFWYTGRRGDLAPWFEKGDLDGLTIRVTLDPDGTPLMVDIMNNCGCYHFFVPSQSHVDSLIEIDFELDALVPAWLPTTFPEKQLQVRINTGWHQVEHITTEYQANESTTYKLVPYDEMEHLTSPDGTAIALFDKEGILKISHRIEPYIFFSMGIPKVGYMRQRGRHPVKMLGRAHFDDPDIIQQNFKFR